MNKCKKCNNNCEGEYCFHHKPRKPIKKVPMLKKALGMVTPTYDAYDKPGMLIVFYNIWKSLPHKSEVSGEYLGPEISSIYFHHILPKGKYPQACLDEENIILLTGDEHTNVENNMYKYEIINTRREELKKKYNL